MLLAIGALGFAYLAQYVQSGPANKVPTAMHRQEVEPRGPSFDRGGVRDDGEPESSRHASRGEKVLVPEVESGNRIKMVTAETRHQDPKVYVVERTIEAFHLKGGKVEHVNVVGGIAKIDFNEAVTDGMGSMEGGTFLKALQLALGQFKDVDQIAFTVDGQPIDTLDGHLEVTDPVEVIRPDATIGGTQERP